MNKFINKYNKEIKKLTMFIPIVSRVHGSHHHEFYEVEKLFNMINHKIINESYELDVEFVSLREVTNNYLVPSDTCESYEYVYVTLKELDELYSK